jgi:hypothetical protein
MTNRWPNKWDSPSQFPPPGSAIALALRDTAAIGGTNARRYAAPSRRLVR